MEDYKKPPLTYKQHLDLLTTRGLIINNPEYAMLFLKQVNYYRFTAYCVPYQKAHDVFITGTYFESIVNLYKLDEELRNNIFAILSPIEVFLRTQTAYELSHGWGPFAHYDVALFPNPTNHCDWIVELEKNIKDSHEPFLGFFKSKYNGFPKLPLWMTCEVMSLGSLSRFYSCLSPVAQRPLCSIIGVDHKVFKSWLHTLTYVRNICAHHSRLWCRNIIIEPMVPNKIPDWAAIKFNNRKLFTCVAIMEWICRAAELPTDKLVLVYETMGKIAALDPRFAGLMGVPLGRSIDMCWGIP
jgi:abortive infection bacteriophage resistance protein